MSDESNSETVEFYHDKVRAALISATATAFTLPFIWIAVAGQKAGFGAEYNPIEFYLLFGGGALFFGSIALEFAKVFFRNKPGLTLSSAGFVDHTTSISPGFVSWSKVTGTAIRNVKYQRFLVVYVDQPASVISGNFLQRALQKLNSYFYGSPINISLNTLNVDRDKVLAQFRRFRNDYDRTDT